MLSVNSKSCSDLQKLLCGLAFVIAFGFAASMSRADDRVTSGTTNNPTSSSEDSVPTEGRSANDVGQLLAQVKELRAELRRLTEILERHLAETDGPADKKAVPPTHELPGPRVVMLYFTATWCGPCQTMTPVIERLKREGFPLRTVDVDAESKTVKQYNVRSIPFFQMVVDGKPAEQVSGITTERRLREMLRVERGIADRVDRVDVVKEFDGDIADSHLELSAPASGIIGDSQTWTNLCKSWNIDDGTNGIDFASQFVLVTTAKGSAVSMSYELNSDGNLMVKSMFTADYRKDGFRYLAVVVSRKGVKSVNGKLLPAPQPEMP